MQYRASRVHSSVRTLAPAIGQSIVIPLSVSVSEVQKTGRNELTTVVVYKPEFRRQKQYVQFPGGMLEKGQSFEEAAMAELKEETNITVLPKNLVLIYEQEKKQAGFSGTFPVKWFLALKSDFSTMFNPYKGERGEDGEIPLALKLGDVKPGCRWQIPTHKSLTVPFFPIQLQMIREMERRNVV